MVLSGTANDGTLGLKAIKDAGGITFAQDYASASHGGMPGSAVLAGTVDFILPPEEIPLKILELTRITIGHGEEAQSHTAKPGTAQSFQKILSLLRVRKGTDFTYYKQTTIQRRIRRRMALNNMETPDHYLKFLREDQHEQDVLYQDLLIPVTEFFRDKSVFDHVCDNLLPEIVRKKAPEAPVRIWVAGCSTGQEAFSMAICFRQALGAQTKRVQIFATDISEPAIAKARAAVYTKSEVDGIGTEMLRDFFTKTNGSFRVKKEIRDMCVFAKHDFLKDPPFGKMDLISCRNVLIYLEPYLQKKALTTFHYALNPKSFLLLGKSESINSVPDLFETAQKSINLFSGKDVPARFMQVATQRNEDNLQEQYATDSSEPAVTVFQKAADEEIRKKYMPAGVVVNEAFDIVYYRGRTNDYLEQQEGKPSNNVLRLAKAGLAFELRHLLHLVKKEKSAHAKENILIQDKLPGTQDSSHARSVSLEIFPLNPVEPHYLILFHAGAAIRHSEMPPATDAAAKESQSRIQDLEQQILQTHEEMRSITEEQEAVNEELQSANEELLSSSEELQSLNEELESSKEELQSTNEELMVVNQEINGLTEQLREARDYAEAIVATIHDALIILDKRLQIKSANAAFYKGFGLTEEETEGRHFYEICDRQWDTPEMQDILNKVVASNASYHDVLLTHTSPGGEEKIMLLNASRLIRKKDGMDFILISISDVTEVSVARRKAEKEQIIREEQKDEFISIASHELKTPLTTAKAYMQMLELTLPAGNEDAGLFLQKASHSINRLNDLINELLDVSKIRLGKLEYRITTFDFNELMRQTVENMQLTTQKHQLLLSGNVADQVSGDKDRLQQVLINLISNAIKYAPDADKVYLTMAQEGDQITVSVRDTGIGISKESLTQIFEKYHRVAEHAINFQGLGIGLYIS